MKHLKTALCMLVVAGCSESTSPSGDPPPSWGVPVTGGTMMIAKDGRHAVISDTDRDRIVAVDVPTGKTTGELALNANDEPGRLVEDAAGRVHVALRRGGALLTLTNISDAEIADRRAVCPEPRGLAYDAATDLVHVACTNGDLVSLPAAGGAEVRRLHLEGDLRDIVVQGNQLLVSRFRSSEVLTLDAAGAIVSRQTPPNVQRFGDTGLVDAVPAVAWRMISLDSGKVLVSHQRQVKTILGTTHGGYGGMCGGSIESAITVMQPGQQPQALQPFSSGALPVDVAINPSHDTLAFVFAGESSVQTTSTTILSSVDQEQCGPGGGGGPIVDDGAPAGGGAPLGSATSDQLGIPTSVGYLADGKLVIFYPELPGIVVRDDTGAQQPRTIWLSGKTGYDSGRKLFHTQTAVGIACASCHPEGRDDGLVWEFDFGMRRTQMPAGHILARAPYHWSGDMGDLGTLMSNVFTERMAGGELTHSQLASLGPWLDRVPAPAAQTADVDAGSIARGKAIFEANDAACVTCHGGDLKTNSALVNVGTGGTFKVPSLVGISARAPYLHDGCAATLEERFGPCGGGDSHGKTSQLTSAQIADLVAYLKSL